MKNKKLTISIATSLAAITPIAALVSCNPSESFKISIDENSMSKDETLKNLKNKFPNIDKSEMRIVFNKAETSDQFKKVISLFNKYFGTKLKANVVGGTTNIDSVAASKLGTAKNDILLISSAKSNYFENNKASFIDTTAKTMLDLPSYDQKLESTFDSGNKHMMNSMTEGYGVIYNKTEFEKININVHEGEGSPNKINDQKASLTIPTKLNNPAISYKQNGLDGVYENADNHLDVYTNDMTKQGWVQLVDFIKSKSKKTFFPLDKSGKGNIWPMTNHLMVVSLTEDHKNAPNKMKDQDPTKVFTNSALEGFNWAIDLYKEGSAPSKNTNTVKDSISALANGQVTMVQNGTWNNQSLKEDDNKNEFGFLPIPIFNKSGKSVITKTIGQWWGATTLAKGNKLNTAKLFLQFLYLTQSGLTTIQNDLSFTTPFDIPKGIKLNKVKNELFKSLGNYMSTSPISNASASNLYVEINNEVPSFVSWVNKDNRGSTTNDFLSSEDSSGKSIQTSWDELKAKKNGTA